MFTVVVTSATVVSSDGMVSGCLEATTSSPGSWWSGSISAQDGSVTQLAKRDLRAMVCGVW